MITVTLTDGTTKYFKRKDWEMSYQIGDSGDLSIAVSELYDDCPVASFAHGTWATVRVEDD